jgi:hypothetical protein
MDCGWEAMWGADPFVMSRSILNSEDEENRYFFIKERVDQLIPILPCWRRERADPLLRLRGRRVRERDRHAQGEQNFAY